MHPSYMATCVQSRHCWGIFEPLAAVDWHFFMANPKDDQRMQYIELEVITTVGTKTSLADLAFAEPIYYYMLFSNCNTLKCSIETITF